MTGATGFVGGELARQLREAGHEVRAVVRRPDNAIDLAELGIDLYAGDITDKDSLRAPMAGVDGLFHVAGWYQVGVPDTSPARRINVDGTRNVLEVMRELAIPKGVYTSSLAIYSDTHGRLVDEHYRFGGPWLSQYDRSKAEAHFQVAEPMIDQGLPLVIVIPGAVYGPGDHSAVRDYLVQYLRGEARVVPDGLTLCWGHVEDIAHAHILAMERGSPGESYIIAGPPYSIEEVLRKAERITGIEAPRLRISPGVLRAIAGVMALIERFAALPPDYSPESLRTMAGTTYLGSNAKATRELGLTHRDFDTGLAETLAYEMKINGIAQPARC